jgi:hypothetical protein
MIVARERQKVVDSGGSGRYRGAAWGASEFPTATTKEVRKPNRVGNLSEAPTGTVRRAGLIWRVV